MHGFELFLNLCSNYYVGGLDRFLNLCFVTYKMLIIISNLHCEGESHVCNDSLSFEEKIWFLADLGFSLDSYQWCTVTSTQHPLTIY